MRVFIVYAHPSKDSFTYHALKSFISGLEEAGHIYVISDLYEMDFKTDMSESEYFREANYRDDLPVADDVLIEQGKINSCDAIAFIYPIFWTEAPAKLVGWFDRVWTFGFAYGARTMKPLEKALCICTAGRSVPHLEQFGQLEGMKAVMLGDRIFDRAKYKDMIVLDSMTKHSMEDRENNWDKHLATAFNAGLQL